MSSGLENDYGELIIEGKTKKIFNSKSNKDRVIVFNKDRITAQDGLRAHEMEGKAEISTQTNCLVFQILNESGIATAFIEKAAPNVFIAKKCKMVPLEWITRRLATGSYLKRHPGTVEKFKFCPPLIETFFKDDANHDPLWSEEQILGAQLENIGQTEIDIMKKTSRAVFEVLEKVWASLNCTLVDMKIEFGIDSNGEILVADVIDSDSWRLWPEGKKELMKDKQVYRNLAEVTSEDLLKVKSNFSWISDKLESFQKPSSCLVVVIMGSPSDLEYTNKIKNTLDKYKIPNEQRIVSAHKETAETLKVVAEYEGTLKNIVFIAVAGRSNGLGPVIAGNTMYPVINCPPPDNDGRDIWSSLNMPGGLGCSTVLQPENAAIAAGQILAQNDVLLWSKFKVAKLNIYKKLKQEDQTLLRTQRKV